MCEDHNRSVRAEAFQVRFEPLELLVPELAQTARLKIQDIDEANEMDAILGEAVPTRAPGVDSFQVAFAVELAAIVKHIVLPGNMKHVLGPAALEYFIEGIEFLRFRQLGDISSMNQEGWRSGHRVNAIESNLESLGNILIGVFAKANVAIADLEKAKIGSHRQRASRCSCDLGERF